MKDADRVGLAAHKWGRKVAVIEMDEFFELVNPKSYLRRNR